MIAEILDRFSSGAIGQAVLGLVAALSIGVLVLTGLNQARRLFGKRPTLNEIMAKLVSVADHDEYKEQVRLRCLDLEQRIEHSRQNFEKRANVDSDVSKRASETIFRLIGEADNRSDKLSGIISRLEERTETHIRKFDQLEGKLDRAIERLPNVGQKHPRGDHS